MDITTTTDKPIRQKPYFTPLKKFPIVDKAIDNMLAAHNIRPSVSPWSSPIVIVPKKDGSKMFCVDFRKLNAVSKPNSYPLPKIDETLALLVGSNYFSALDCRQVYFQVKKWKKQVGKRLPFVVVGACLSLMSCPLGSAMPQAGFKN